MRGTGSKHPWPLLRAWLTLRGRRQPQTTPGQVHHYHPPLEASAQLPGPHSSQVLVPSSLRGIFTAQFRAIHPVPTGYRSKTAGEPHSCRLHSQFPLRLQVLQQSWPKPSPWHGGRGRPSTHVSGFPPAHWSLLLSSSPTLSCRIMCPEVYRRLSWKSVSGGKTSSSGR